MPRATGFALLLLTVALVGCRSSGGGTDTALDTQGLRIDRLHDRMDRVAAAQAAAIPQVRGVLAAVHELDDFVAGMRDPDTIDATEDRWPRVVGAVDEVDPDGLREPLIDLALAVDSARAALAGARDAVTSTWERDYLDAEDQVLQRVRDYAQATDALIQVVQQHWPTYRQAYERSADYVDANERYRSHEEAVAAYEVRVGRLLGPLGQAQSAIARFAEQQAAAARAVNEASAATARLWSDRPTARPSATS